MNALPQAHAKVLVRRLRPQDLVAFQAYRHDAEVARYQGWRPQSDAQALAFLQAMAAAPLLQPGVWCQLALADPHSDELMGDVGLCLSADGQSLELGLSLARAWQGQGRASASLSVLLPWVFSQTCVTTIEASTDQRNLACQALLSRAGMVCVASQPARYHGESCVEQMYVLARPKDVARNNFPV